MVGGCAEGQVQGCCERGFVKRESFWIAEELSVSQLWLRFMDWTTSVVTSPGLDPDILSVIYSHGRPERLSLPFSETERLTAVWSNKRNALQFSLYVFA